MTSPKGRLGQIPDTFRKRGPLSKMPCDGSCQRGRKMGDGNTACSVGRPQATVVVCRNTTLGKWTFHGRSRLSLPSFQWDGWTYAKARRRMLVELSASSFLAPQSGLMLKRATGPGHHQSRDMQQARWSARAFGPHGLVRGRSRLREG